MTQASGPRLHEMVPLISSVRLVGAAYIFSVAVWFALEGSAAMRYFPAYSWEANMISDLGVPYMHTDGLHWMDYSPLSWLMNLNFFVTACLYAFPHWLLLFVTNGEDKTDKRLRSGRAALSAFYMVGLILVGAVHGGPREHADGSIREHELGATFAIVGGNLCSILAGLSPAQIRPVVTDLPYRVASIALGAGGLISVIALITITPKAQAGTVERLAVYTVFAWQLLTGTSLLVGTHKLTAQQKVKAG